jgi:16S rRNA (guanine(966)-N(2))-methyltransferase RsmD
MTRHAPARKRLALSHPTRSAAAAAPGEVRIISGQYRRTPIPVVSAPGLRPTPDRMRQTLFNWLNPWVNPWSAAHVLDLFAGSGALGFECASRGAAEVVLVEAHPGAAAALARWAERLHCAGVRVVPRDWRQALETLPKAHFNLAFLDPPYDAGFLPDALKTVTPLLTPGGLIYAESGQRLDAAHFEQFGLSLLRHARAGAVHGHLLRAQSC